MQTLPTSSTLNKLFYSINMVVAERNCLYVLDECFFLSVCEQAAEFSKSRNLIGFVILYELLCRS